MTRSQRHAGLASSNKAQFKATCSVQSTKTSQDGKGGEASRLRNTSEQMWKVEWTRYEMAREARPSGKVRVEMPRGTSLLCICLVRRLVPHGMPTPASD